MNPKSKPWPVTRSGWAKHYARQFDLSGSDKAAQLAMWYQFLSLAFEDEPVGILLVQAPAVNVRQQKAKALWETTCFPTSELERRTAAQQLLDFKKAAKVSWTTLGLPYTAGADLVEMTS